MFQTPMEGATSELEIDSELVMSFYDQVKGNDSSYIIILRIMTDYLMFSLDYSGDTNYIHVPYNFCFFIF